MSVTHFLADFANSRVYEIGSYALRDLYESVLEGVSWTEKEFCDLWLKRATTTPHAELEALIKIDENVCEDPVDLAARYEVFAREVYAFCVSAEWEVEAIDEAEAGILLEEQLFVFAGSCYHLGGPVCPGCGQAKEDCTSTLDPRMHGALLFEARGTGMGQVLVPTVDLFFRFQMPIVLLAEAEVCEQFDVTRLYRHAAADSDFSDLRIDIEGPDDRPLKIVVWGVLEGDVGGKFALETQESLRGTLGEDWLRRYKIFPKRLQGAHRMPKPRLEVIAGGKS